MAQRAHKPGDEQNWQQIASVCPKIAPEVVAALLQRFDAEYSQQFQPNAIARHITALTSLSSHTPAIVFVDRDPDDTIHCTVAAFDHAFEFSSITGLLAAAGLNIDAADAFTLRPPRATREDRLKALRRRGLGIRQRDFTRESLILDHFRGRRVDPARQAKRGDDFEHWSNSLKQSILEVMRMLDESDATSAEQAKRLVAERVTQWLRNRRKADPHLTGLIPIDVAVEPLPRAIRLHLRAPDMPGFLYALSMALSLHDLDIFRTRARTIAGRSADEIDVIDPRGPTAAGEHAEQLRLSVLLTQQFFYFLDRASDPLTALRRFEELSQKISLSPRRADWLALLSSPLSMLDLARLLGASDYLWEDVIRTHAEILLPVLQNHAASREIVPPARSLPRRLDETLAVARNFDEERRRQNEFKDRELFLIEIDNILGAENPDLAFQILSERLVQLAETLVAAAARLVHTELVRLYGQPRDARGDDAHWAIFGLGKFGGVALGYASDIEMLFVFDSPGRTKGGSRGELDNDEFFAIFTRETCAYIQAKRKGIFEIDLRLRPHGKNGPLACSLETFNHYYDPKGDAHPFERMALARLRWIAGDARLGHNVEQARDTILYAPGASLDLDAVWEISQKIRAQHCPPRQLNSKFSPGGLTDLETMVQMLQVMHAPNASQLQTPRLNEAIQSLHRAGVLSSIDFDELMGAYQFLRRMINAQRMLRGSARDLMLPPADSDELLHLARRMNYSSTNSIEDLGQTLLADFSRHTKCVRRLIQGHLGRGPKA